MALGKKTGGRKKGTPNKTTASVKEALSMAFDQLGGVDSLVRWGEENPTQFYNIWAKILPQEVHNKISGDPEAPLEVKTKVVIVPQKQAAVVDTKPIQKTTD